MHSRRAKTKQCKDTMDFCEKNLSRCTKVAFQLWRETKHKKREKLVKSLSDDAKKALSEKNVKLAETQKALCTTMKSGGTIVIDRAGVEEAIADGEALCAQLNCVSQMT